MALKTVLASLMLLFFCGHVFADQVLSASDSPFLQTHWTTENGLPQNTILAIVQAPDGYLWLATFGGLARFDGLKFTIFNTGNTPALKSNRLTALHLGRDGALWIGAETGEISRFHHGEFRFFAQLTHGAAGERAVHGIYEDRSGTIWVGAGVTGVMRFAGGDPAQSEYYDARQGMPTGQMTSICEDRDGNLWVGALDGLAVFREGKFTTALKFGPAPSKFLIRIYPHSDGGLWLLTPTSLSRFYTGRLNSLLSFPFNSTLSAGLIEGKAKDLLLCYSMDRIFRLNGGVATVNKLSQTSGFAVYSMLEDHEGNLWLGSIGNGLIRVQRRRVTMFTSANGLPGGGGGPVLEDQNGGIWIGAPDGLCHLSGGKVTNYFVRGAAKDGKNWMISALHLNQAGDLWIGKDKGIARYRDGRFTEFLHQEVRMVSAIYEDRQGCLWVGTLDGLAQFRDGKVTKYSQRHGLVHDDVKFIMEDRAGALWLGTPGGLSRFQNGVFTNYTTGEGLSNNYVRAIYEDRDGALWLGTYGGGLNRWQNGQIRHLTTKNGLFDDFVSRILVDEKDDFWMLGNRGIFHLRRQVLDDFIAGKSKSVTSTIYNVADGMDPSEGNGGFQPAGWRLRNGRLWFPTIRGMAIVDPAQISSIPSPVAIERVLLDGEELSFRQGVEVPPGKANLEVHYTGLNLGKPEMVQFSFKLHGLHDWLDVGRRRAAYFTNLAPGRYTFSVKALSPDGIWSEQEASLNIIVRPPFWRTTWFFSLVLMLVVGLALLGYRWRVSQYRQRSAQQEAFARELIVSQERDRQRIAAEIHDGLGQSLIIIKRRAMIGLDGGNDPERLQEHLREIAEASDHAIDEVREAIFDLRPLQLDRLGLTGAISDLLSRMADTHGWRLTRHLDELDGVFTKEAENSLFRVVQEAINNISKHAEATEVALSLNRWAEAVELVILDNGRGFITGSAASEPARGGFGLRGIVERTRLLGGQAVIESKPGKGTEIRLRLPLSKSPNT
jgi:signal transduction histidine kinase/ligand-binding sensor domain-containing protein